MAHGSVALPTPDPAFYGSIWSISLIAALLISVVFNFTFHVHHFVICLLMWRHKLNLSYQHHKSVSYSKFLHDWLAGPKTDSQFGPNFSGVYPNIDLYWEWFGVVWPACGNRTLIPNTGQEMTWHSDCLSAASLNAKLWDQMIQSDTVTQ